MFKRILVIALLMLALLPAVGVLAQTSEPTAPPAEATAEPEQPPVIYVEVPDSTAGFPTNTVLALAVIVVAVVSGVALAIQQRSIKPLADGYTKMLKDKQVMDEAERQFLMSSISFKDLVVLLRSGFTFGSGMNLPGVDPYIDATKEFLDAISDGLPNDQIVSDLQDKLIVLNAQAASREPRG